MNTFRKLPDGAWGVLCDAQHVSGATVTVTLRDGRTKAVELAEQVGTWRENFIYATAAPKPVATTAIGDLSGVLALFAKAQQYLKFPAIVLSVPAADLTLRLSVAGPRAKVPGSITVLDANKQNGDRDWLGRITTDGAYQPSRLTNGRTEAIVARLREFARDPARVAADHGKLTAVCCFCNQPLGRGKDKRSVDVGYGPDCADHFGLPWGVKKVPERIMESVNA